MSEDKTEHQLLLKEIAEGLLRDNSIYYDEIIEYRYENGHHFVAIDDGGELNEFVFPGVINFEN